MSEIFGIEFDKHIYKSLFDEIDFKDLKGLMANKNAPNKLQYFVQEFPALVERPDFTNIFTHILYTTSNQSTAYEIFEGLNKMARLSQENQFKILVSFIYSMNERFQEDTTNILITKCQELHKEGKSDQLSHSTVQSLLLLINSLDALKNDTFLTSTFTNFLVNTQGQSHHQHALNENSKQIVDIENLIENTSTTDESIDFEKVLYDLGPLIINNAININSPDLIDTKVDERRLASFIIFLCKHQTWVEDKENRYLNKVFLKTLNNDQSNSVDEITEKKMNVAWNIDSYYKMFKNQIDSQDVSKYLKINI